MIDKVTLGKRIRERRKVNGLMQVELGKRIGCAVSAYANGYYKCLSISNWERGHSFPQLRFHGALKRELGDDLFDDEPPPPPLPPAMVTLRQHYEDAGNLAAAYVVRQCIDIVEGK